MVEREKESYLVEIRLTLSLNSSQTKRRRIKKERIIMFFY